MADAIKFQLYMANGALNLSYNEIVKTWYNDNVICSAELTPLDWSILIVYDTRVITSFILFRDAYSSISTKRDGYIYGITPNGTQVAIMSFANYGGSPSGPGFSFNGLLILAK